MREGRLIEFKDKKRVLTAVCTRVDAGSARILTEANKEFNLPLAKILHEGPGLDPKRSRGELVEAMKAFAAHATAQEVEVDLASLWELLQDDEPRPYALIELAEFLFSGPKNAVAESALLRRLIDDPLYFEQDGVAYVPRSAKAVEQTLHQRAVETQRAEQRAAIQRWVQSVWQDQPGERPAGADAIVRLLAELAIFGSRAERYQEGGGFLQEIGLGGLDAAETAFTLMVKLGEWDTDENLLLHEHNLAEPFSEAAHAETRAAVTTAAEIARRTDLRHLHLMTIDDEDTRDIDDAVSFESLPDGYRVGIHVADVASFVPLGSALDEAGKRRSTSIYLPDSKIDMLPPKLAHDLCSLVAGEDRLAMSVLVTFNAEDQIVGHEIVESVVCVTERFSYNEVDALYEQRADLSALLELSQKLQARRVAAGAVVFSMPELRLSVDADKTIHLKRIEQASSSQRLVSEMMVMANQLIGEFMQERGIPALYRTQPAPEAPVVQPGAGGPVQMDRQRRQLKRSQLTTEPGPHYGLGLTIYTQATSPIRRYGDLLVHRQLKHALQGEPVPHRVEDLKHLAAMTEQGINVVNQVQRYAHKYWLLKHLQSVPNEPLQAIVLDVYDDRAQVQLTDYLLEVSVYPKLSRKLVPGEVVFVGVENLRPRRGTIALTLLDAAPTPTEA
ncbi:MAG: VacB/RNase II family 3'-5' exoribonuclease [Candidatus Sericytochromatia bacterium]|nr:VacB/RNase II family 3'-5' exoribonuclease [Candidatus Sericytochromatia bacterium]